MTETNRPEERSAWTRLRGGLADVGGFLLEALYALGRLLRRGWIHVRPTVLRVWSRVRPHVVRVGGNAWTWLRRRGTRTGRWAVALGPRLKRPLFMTVRTVLIAVVIGGLVLSVGRGSVRRTPPGTIGVRHVQWGGAGVIEEDFGPGLQRTIVGRDTWHHLPAGTHRVLFASEAEGGTHPPLEVATREGEAAQVSVFVPYRITPGRAWRIVADGLRSDYRDRAVAICRRVLLEELGELSAEEFADTDARSEVERSALARLGQELGVPHLQPLDVRIGSVFFEPNYEKKMLEKQLAAQAVLTQESMSLRKEEQRKNDEELQRLKIAEEDLIQGYALRREQLTDAHALALETLGRGSKQYEARRRSETDVEVLRLRNEGELALMEVADLRERLFDEALESTGGRLHVAREAAENLRFGKVTLNSNDPRVPSVLDLDELVALLMGSSED